MKVKTLRIVIAYVFLFTTGAAIAGAQRYVITDLGSLTPVAINTWGQVVGNDKNQAYVWTRWGGTRALGTLSGGTFSSAAAINDFGMVAGTADGSGIAVSPSPSFQNQDCSDLTQPFIWRYRNGMQGLGTVATQGDLVYPFTWCSDPFYATAINDLGQVVGYDGGYDTYQYGFLQTSSAGMSAFGGSWPPTSANGISNVGLIVGQNSTDSTYGVGHATSWENGVATDLGTLGGGADVLTYSSLASGVNDKGQVVGWSSTAPIPFYGWLDSPVHAVLWTARTGIRDLGTLPGDTLSTASKINFFGEVVGASGNTAVLGFGESPLYEVTGGHAFIWSERRGMLDLNDFIPANPGWILNSAVDINIWGQIVGSGTRNGEPHGFLLTPRRFYHF